MAEHIPNTRVFPEMFMRQWFKFYSERRGHEPGVYDHANFGAAVSKLRELSGLTRSQFAAQVGMSPNAVSMIEMHSRPRIEIQILRFQNFAQLLSLYELRTYFEQQARQVRQTSKSRKGFKEPGIYD